MTAKKKEKPEKVQKSKETEITDGTEVEIDVTEKEGYYANRQKIDVLKDKNPGGYERFMHIPASMKSIYVGYIRVENSKLELKKDNVTMVLAFFTDSTYISLVEAIYKEKDKDVRRYFARDYNVTGQWAEYKYFNDNLISSESVDKLLDVLVKREFPLNRIVLSGGYFTFVKYHGTVPQKCGPPKSISSVGTDNEYDFYYFIDTEAQYLYQEGEEKDMAFLHTGKGMATAVAGGCVGGAVVGGTLIYMIS